MMNLFESSWLGPEEWGLITTLVEDKNLVEIRHAQIVQAATQLFQKKGYHSTTIREIAKESGIGIGSIYQYVKNKEEILFLILVYILRRYEFRLAAGLAQYDDPREQLKAAIRTYYSIVDEEHEKVVLAYRETRSLLPEHRQHIMELELRTNSLFKKILEDGIEKNVFRSVNVDVTTYNIIIFGHMWALKRWFFQSRMTLNEYIDVQIENIMASIDVAYNQ